MKKKVLLIIPRTIFPIVSGYSIKNYNLIQILNRHFILKLVVISEHKIDEKETEFYTKNSNEFYYFHFSKWHYILNALLALFSSYPLQVKYYYFTSVNHKIEELLLSCDIVIGALVRTIGYTKNAPKNIIRIFDMVDSIGLNYMHSQKQVKSIFWKLLYHIEAHRVMKYEEKWIKNSNITYFFNQEECQYWNQYGNTQWLPHGVNSTLIKYNKIDKKYTESVAFIGKMNYQPNIDAIKWYVENVHCRIGKIVPLIIIGAFPTQEIKNLAQKYSGITITGFIDDPYLILNSVMLAIAPMQTGGGIQNKVLEAMALGKINIVSSLAATPIVGAKDMEHYIIANSPNEYIDKILEIKQNPEKYDFIGIKARDHIKNNFSWDKYEQEYIKGINSLF